MEPSGNGLPPLVVGRYLTREERNRIRRTMLSTTETPRARDGRIQLTGRSRALMRRYGGLLTATLKKGIRVKWWWYESED